MPDFELLIAGDGCTDGTREVVRSFDDPRIRWFDLPKAPGIGYANRNAVLREARGRDIAYLAHDDIWFPDHLERLGALLDRSGVEYAYTRGLGVDIEGRMLPYWYNLSVDRHQAGLWRGDSAITMCTVAHSRACLDKYGYWDETMSFGADVVMWHRILMGGRFKNLAFDPNPTSLHFVANWRDTKAHRRRSWIAGRLLDNFVNETLPDSLRLRARPDRTQQEAAWLWLARNPTALVGEIRDGVVQLSDTMLWRSRTQPRLVGLRARPDAGVSARALPECGDVGGIASTTTALQERAQQDASAPARSSRRVPIGLLGLAGWRMSVTYSTVHQDPITGGSLLDKTLAAARRDQQMATPEGEQVRRLTEGVRIRPAPRSYRFAGLGV